MKLIKKSKFKKTAIIAGIVVLALLLPQVAKADILSNILGSVGKDILITLGQAAHYVLNWLLKAAAAVFSGVLDIGFDSNIVGVAKIGWTVTRNFANMFFILFLVIIAFTTILRLPRYGIKDLLPKVIIVALLINFSFVIASVIIDFSNITADFFIKDIKNKIGGEERGIVSVTFVDSLNVMGVFKSYTDCREFFDQQVEKCTGWQNTWKQVTPFLGPALFSLNKCLEKAGKLAEQCEKYGSITVKDDNYASDANFLELFLSITVGIIVLLIATFVLFAGAIMLLIRIIALWILIVIVPLAFMCIVMPGLRRNWQQWWSAFLKWCFFAPIYAFFVWMAIRISILQIHNLIATSTNTTTPGNWGPGTNPFTADPGTQIISYGIIIAFLVGGLIAAQRLSIYGASTAMNIVNKAKQGTVNWAKRTSMRPVKALGTAVGAGALTAGGKLFGDTKLGRRMRAKATEVRTRPEKYPQNVAYERLISSMSDGDAMKEMMVKAITPEQRIRKLIATRNVAKRGLLRDATAPEAKEAMKTFKSFNDFEAYQKLKESRLDAIEYDTERNNTTQKVVQEGNLNKVPAIALKDEKVIAAIGRFASAVQMESLRNASPQHAKNLEDSLRTLTTAGNAILAGMSALDQEKIHHSYASQTGDTTRLGAHQSTWGQKAGVDGLKRIIDETHVTTQIAMNIPINQLKNILEKIQNPNVAKKIVQEIANSSVPGSPRNKMVYSDPYFQPYL